jgi:hypothetical protein
MGAAAPGAPELYGPPGSRLPEFTEKIQQRDARPDPESLRVIKAEFSTTVPNVESLRAMDSA